MLLRGRGRWGRRWDFGFDNVESQLDEWFQAPNGVKSLTRVGSRGIRDKTALSGSFVAKRSQKPPEYR